MTLAACLLLSGGGIAHAMMESPSFQMSGGMNEPVIAGSTSYTLQGGISMIGEDRILRMPANQNTAAPSGESPVLEGKPVLQKSNNPKTTAQKGAVKNAQPGPKPPPRNPPKPQTPSTPQEGKPAAPKPVTPAAPSTKPQQGPSTKNDLSNSAPAKAKLSVENMHENRELRKDMRQYGTTKQRSLDAIRNRKKMRAHLPLALQAAILLLNTMKDRVHDTAQLTGSLMQGAGGSAGVGAAIGAAAGALGVGALNRMRQPRKKKSTARRRRAAFWLCASLIATGALAPMLVRESQYAAYAQQSAPKRFAYNGRLLQNGSPVTTAHAIRFSYWKSPNAVAGDRTGDGNINIAAPNFAAWQETFVITPDGQGYFSVELGSSEELPDMGALSFGTMLSLYLQVEVKPASAPSSAFELMDPNPGNDAIDRTGMLSVPFALNADMVDRRGVGTGSGSIPILGPGGVLPASVIPVALPSDSFTIDSNDSATAPALRFGDALNETLTFDTLQSRFSFSDDVHIAGNLTLTGTINGIDLEDLASAVSGSGSTVVRTLHPAFPGALLEGDGTANVGRLSLEEEPSTENPAYRWQTSRTTLQDYDIVLRVALPPDFTEWAASPLAFAFKTGSPLVAQSAMQVQVFDTDGNAVTLSGGPTTLADTDWTVETRGFSGSPTWEAGKDVVIRFTLKAKNVADAWLGPVTLRFETE